jgi:hypothetical protein
MSNCNPTSISSMVEDIVLHASGTDKFVEQANEIADKFTKKLEANHFISRDDRDEKRRLEDKARPALIGYVDAANTNKTTDTKNRREVTVREFYDFITNPDNVSKITKNKNKDTIAELDCLVASLKELIDTKKEPTDIGRGEETLIFIEKNPGFPDEPEKIYYMDVRLPLKN